MNNSYLHGPLNISAHIAEGSLFIFGPRQTGNPHIVAKSLRASRASPSTSSIGGFYSVFCRSDSCTAGSRGEEPARLRGRHR
jgi:hypothetical protein